MSSQTPQIDWDAIARYLAGESPASERESIQQWLASHPTDAKQISGLDDALNELKLGPDATAGIDIEAALAKVNARRANEPKQLRPTTRPWSIPWIPLAAAAGLVIAVGSLVWKTRPAQTSLTVASRQITTPVGVRDSIVLPDGSRVTLGQGSRLTIAADYGIASRRVIVHGEAYFDVKHDAKHPFLVQANDATIRDVGTAFVVHTDSTDGVRVSVTQGTVEFDRPGSPVLLLNAGDIGRVSSDGHVVASRGAGTADDLAWTTGKLVFRNATIAEVRDDLRRWYGIELGVRDPALLGRHLTATFDGDSARLVLDVIGRALGATIERHGDTAVVRVTPETTRRK